MKCEWLRVDVGCYELVLILLLLLWYGKGMALFYLFYLI